MGKLSKEQLLLAKETIMSGKSITSVSKGLAIDRKELKKNILELLDEDEKKRFEKKLYSNYRKNRVNKRIKKRVINEEAYKKAVEELVKKGINKDDIETIYTISSANPHTKLAKDTFVFKILDLLEFCEQRNQGLDENSRGYITKKDLLQMLQRDPKLITSDVNGKINPICEILDEQEKLGTEDVNEIIKNNPHIFRNSVLKMRMLSIIGENFLVRDPSGYIELFEYIVREKPYMLNINIEKMFKRLVFLKEMKSSTILAVEDLNSISRKSYINTDMVVDDSNINSMYIFPEYDKKNPEKFRREVRRSLRVKTDNVKEQ